MGVVPCLGYEWLTELEIRDVVGDEAQGGYVATLSFWNAQCEVPMYREITLYNHNFSGDTWEGDDRLAMNGVMVPSTLTADRSASRSDVAAYSFHNVFDLVPVTGCYFTDDAAGTLHDLGAGATLADVVNHLATVHITITGGVDVTQIDPDADSTPFGDAYIVRENASLWQAFKKIAKDEFFVIYFDRENRLVYKPQPQFAVVIPDAVATLDNTMLLAPYRVEFRRNKPRNVILLGLTSAGTVLESTYPAGVGVDLRGPRFEIRCESQARLNILAQRQYEWLARDYTITVLLPGAWDFELHDRVDLTLAGTATNGVDFDWNEKVFWVSSVSYRKLFARGYITELKLEEGYAS